MSNRPTITVRSLMLIVAAFALLFLFVRTRYVWSYLWHVGAVTVLAWGPISLLALILVPRLRDRVPRRPVRVLALVSLAISLYLLWAFFLTMTFWMGEEPPFGWPRGYPFPDRALGVLAEWFDILHPVSGDSIKIHGELPSVLFLVGMLTILATIATGFFFGLLVSPRPAKDEA